MAYQLCITLLDTPVYENITHWKVFANILTKFGDLLTKCLRHFIYHNQRICAISSTHFKHIKQIIHPKCHETQS